MRVKYSVSMESEIVQWLEEHPGIDVGRAMEDIVIRSMLSEIKSRKV